jgi:tetratricopeptide (TPR) repeat protein
MIRHICLTCGLGLILCATAYPDDPQPKTEPKPQWQRMLTGDDAKKAAELAKRVAKSELADKYEEAIRLQKELLELRTKAQGADHWEAVDEKWALMVMKKVAALPEEDRAGWRKASQEENAALKLDDQGKYPEAGRLFQKALDIFRKVVGEDHPVTARGYGSVARNLDAQGRHAEAEPLNRKALEIRRKVLGEDHADTARSYNNLAFNLSAQGRYAEAGPLNQRALDIKRTVLGEDNPSTAISYNNVAMNLNAQGKYAEAGPLLQKALGIMRKVRGEEHPDTALGYNNVAFNLAAQGKYPEAGPLLKKALDIFRTLQGEDHPNTARVYNNIGSLLQTEGMYVEAGPLLQKALDIRRKFLGEEHLRTADSYNNVASNLGAQGKYAEAGLLYQTALNIRRKVLGEDHPATAESYGNIARNLHDERRYADARPLLEKALDVTRRVLGEDHPRTAYSYGMVALDLSAQGKFATALESLESAVRSYEVARLGVGTGGFERSAFWGGESLYACLAAARSRAGRQADAWAALEADLASGLRDELATRRGSGLTPAEQRRRNELHDQRNPINAGILALASLTKRTDAQASELQRLIEQRKELEKSLIRLALAARHREVATLDQLQAALPAHAAFVAWLDEWGPSSGIQERWGCVVRSSGDPHWERLPGSGRGGKWTNEDTELLIHAHKELTKSASASEIDALAKKVYARHLAPLSKHLVGVKRLLFAFSSMGAGIPIEIVANEYTVSYTPSGTYLARLKERERPRGNGVLAVGDPVFPLVKEAPHPTALPPGGLLITQVVPGGNAAKARLQGGDVLVAYAGEDLKSLEQLDKLMAANAAAKSVVVKVWREGQEKMAEREVAPDRLGVMLAKESAREAITARRRTDQMLAKLTRGEDFAELPGTQVEIRRLAGLFDAKNVTTLTRAEASEKRLEEMRKADKLKQFKYLHFATHGKANNYRSFDSALILTPPEKVPEPRAGEPWLDGRLTAAEVLEHWKLDAELVTLSACESALGRQGGGDGLLGFAQAFLLAGSRSVCLTLWQVDDTATALLMDRFYRNLLGKRQDRAKPMGKAAALHEAKQWLRNLSAKDAEERLGTLTNGIVRGEQPAREVMKTVPAPKDAAKDYKPYAHPRYWAAFILIGDPE